MLNRDWNLLFSAIASLAVLLYLAPGALRLSQSARVWTHRAAAAILGLGLAAALVASLFWWLSR